MVGQRPVKSWLRQVGSIPSFSTNFRESGGTVYTADLKSAACNGLTGSSPVSRTKLGLKCSWTHTALSLPKSGDRYPLDPPKPALGPLDVNGYDKGCSCRASG